MSLVFSSISHDISVSRGADGSISWSGQYKGAPIKRAVPIDGGSGKCCILMLDPDANKRGSFENLLCIDRKGNPVWTAKLPASADVFMEITQTTDGILANTWSGYLILLDQNTGVELKRIFVK